MKIELTGAYVETLAPNKHYVIFRDKIVNCFKNKSHALSLAYDKSALEKLTKDNIKFS